MTFFSNLSKNFIKLLEDNEYYDITIEVGKDPNVKILRAHMNILFHRSPYLRRTLASNKKNKDNVLAHIKLSKISPEIFQIILKYMYGGILSLNGQDTLEILKILLAADELFLQELVDYLQKYLVENKTEWMEQHFELIHRTSFQSNSLLEIQQFCTDFMSFIDTNIVNLEIASTISKWIDKTIINNSKSDHLRELYLPYKFQLILRGSRDGCTPKKFHELCDNISHTVTFIKVKETDEILGEYNPLIWKSYGGGWGKTEDSFIFSFKEKDIKSAIISNIKDTKYALNYGATRGPYFGVDIIIRATSESANYNKICCKKKYYQKKIRDTEDSFLIEDYEVHKITKG
ncbi:POZ domain-containing protein [Rhizophagus irregularis]|uniref:POZ domain-containing protein n=1 Tax=Rhizophagus irregularis TaxID=588596 RepID=A0A2N0NSA3_9GLOM|nr:POZ domain-containing protein [Rhizophagus irregularis]